MKQRLDPMDRCDVTAAGHLVYDGVDLSRMALEYETPFYLLSERVLRANHEKFMAAFAGLPGFKPYFSVKTNYESGVLCTLRDLGAGAEVSGGLDFEATRRAGFAPDDIVFDGPSKTEPDLRAAIDYGVHLINVECESELSLIDRLARERRRVVKVGMRIDPVVKNPSYGKLISTYKQKFGFPINDCGAIFELAARCKNVQVVGLHAHIGSQITAPGLYATNLTVLLELAARLKQSGVIIAEINLGGGFPARYRAEVNGIEAYCEAVTRALVRHFGNRMPEVIIEPGRSMVGDAGVIQSEVVLVSRKAANDRKRWVYLDIGKFSGLAETMGESIKYRLRTGHDGTRVGPVVLAGPTCDSADILYEKADYRLPEDLEIGDKLEIRAAGAYTTTYASVAFNGFEPLKTYCV